MKIVVFVILMIALVFLLFDFNATAQAGEDLGLQGGMLLKCPDRPNCVCSEQQDDIDHYIEPIPLAQDITFDPVSLLKDVIQEMGGEVRVANDTYLAATFTSAIFRFVDDLEIRIDFTRKVIHLRSASRVGYSDLGVNRNRSEVLRKKVNDRFLKMGHPTETTSVTHDGTPVDQ